MYISQLPDLPETNSALVFPISIGNGDYKMHLRTKTVSGTTSSSGNLNLNLAGGDNVILFCRRTDASTGAYICTPFWYATTGNLYCHITNDAASPTAQANTAVTVEVVYLSIS